MSSRSRAASVGPEEITSGSRLPRLKAMTTNLEPKMERLTRLVGTDEGFYILALHAFIEYFLRYEKRFGEGPTFPAESPAEQEVAEMLDELGVWFQAQYPGGRYRLDFLVVSPIGTRYDLEIDGRGHLANENIRSDERRDIAVKQSGIEVIRIDARTVFQRPEVVKTVLSRLC